MNTCTTKHNPPGWVTCLLCGYTRKGDRCECAKRLPWPARFLATLIFAPREESK